MVKFFTFLLVLICFNFAFSDDNQDTTLIDLFDQLIIYDQARDVPKIFEQSDYIIEQLDRFRIEENELYAYAKYYRGHGHELINEFEKAIAIYHEILPICKNYSHVKVETEAYLSLARIYETISRPVDCLRNLNHAYDIISKNKLEDIESRYAVRYASYHRIYDDRDVAMIYATKAIKLGHKHNIRRSITDGHLLSGMLHEKIDSSDYHYMKAEELFYEDKAYFTAAFMALNRSFKRIKMKDLKNARKILSRVSFYLNLSVKRNKDYYNILAKLYSYKEDIALEEKNIDSAYYFLVKKTKNNELAQYSIDQQKINEMEIEFAITQERIISSNIKRNIKFLIAGSILLFLLLGVLASYYLKLRNKNTQIEAQSLTIIESNEQLEISNKEKEILLSEVHHRVKNNLQVVMSLLHMYANKIGDDILKDHFDMVSEKVMSISLIHEQLYNNDSYSVINMNDYFQELKSRYEELYNYYSFEVNLLCDNISFNLDTVLPIGIITTELINNAIKYGRKSANKLKITIRLSQENSTYLFVLSDNGSGYAEGSYSKTNKGIGSLLINSMVRQLLAKSHSYNQNGAVFEMSFKEKITSTI